MSIYNNLHQTQNQEKGYAPYLHDNKREASWIVRTNTHPPINERIHLIKEKTCLSESTKFSILEKKPLSKRTLSTSTHNVSSYISMSKPNELAKNKGLFSKPSSPCLAKKSKEANPITVTTSFAEKKERGNWEIIFTKLAEELSETATFLPVSREHKEEEEKTSQEQMIQNQLPLITSLDLSRSKLTSFPPDLFLAFPNLQSLYLHGNPLKTISFKFNQPTCLTQLNISNTQINELPPEMEFFTQLKKLNISRNNISFIPDWVYSLKNLEKFEANNNQITGISHLIGTLNKLELLLINHNKIEELPEKINALVNLKSLIANNNSISTIPPLNNLKKLTTINLSNNKITTIGTEIIGSRKLRELFLSHNKIASISSEIKQLSILIRIVLNNNQLQNLPHEITQLSLLKDLKVQHNPLRALPSNMPNLKELYRFDYSPQSLSVSDPNLNPWFESFQFRLEEPETCCLSQIPFT